MDLNVSRITACLGKRLPTMKENASPPDDRRTYRFYPLSRSIRSLLFAIKEPGLRDSCHG